MCDGTDKRKWKGSRFSGARDHFDRMCDRLFLHEPDRGRDGILAIIFGNKARREAKSGIATAGFVCGIVGLSMCALLFVSCSCYMIYVNRGISYYYW